MVWQIVNDAPASASRIAGLLVAAGTPVPRCVTELQASPFFTPSIIRLAIYCAVSEYSDSYAAIEWGEAKPDAPKYYTACAEFARRTAGPAANATNWKPK